MLVATAEALLQKTSPPRLLREAAIRLEVGKRYDPAALALRLTEAGYSRADQVGTPPSPVTAAGQPPVSTAAARASASGMRISACNSCFIGLSSTQKRHRPADRTAPGDGLLRRG